MKYLITLLFVLTSFCSFSQVSKSEAISIDISEFKLASGYYYLVDVKELKLIRLCPIPLILLREEP
jgi:D-alanyl-lipoteichoic acid acyltransferase DltB (MBOAT superfamily)